MALSKHLLEYSCYNLNGKMNWHYSQTRLRWNILVIFNYLFLYMTHSTILAFSHRMKLMYSSPSINWWHPKLPTEVVRGAWDGILVRSTERKLSLSVSCENGTLQLVVITPLWLNLPFTHGHVAKITMKMTTWERKIYNSLVLHSLS